MEMRRGETADDIEGERPKRKNGRRRDRRRKTRMKRKRGTEERHHQKIQRERV
jgi:hypothetical protein